MWATDPTGVGIHTEDGTGDGHCCGSDRSSATGASALLTSEVATSSAGGLRVVRFGHIWVSLRACRTIGSAPALDPPALKAATSASSSVHCFAWNTEEAFVQPSCVSCRYVLFAVSVGQARKVYDTYQKERRRGDDAFMGGSITAMAFHPASQMKTLSAWAKVVGR